MIRQPPDLSVIVVCWNTKDILRDCLNSIIEETRKRTFEIILIDNASDDGTPEMVRGEFPHVVLIENSVNVGFASGNNIGIEHSQGRYVCLVNSDVIMLDGCLDQLCEFMDKNPEIGVAGPKLLWPNRDLQWSCRRFPSLWIKLCQAFGFSKIFPNTRLFGTEHMTYFKHDRERDVDALVGALLIIRTEAINQVGVLDERFFMYCEEIDLCKRIGDAGWRVTFCPAAHAVHMGRASSNKEPTRFVLEAIKSEYMFWSKHFGSRKAILFAHIIYIKYLIRLLGKACYYSIRCLSWKELGEYVEKEIYALKLAKELKNTGSEQHER